MMPPLGPLNVLWVVEVTMWAYFTGLLSRPAAIMPAVWAMSTMRIAPTLSAISLILAQFHSLEYADAPPMISLGLCSRASFSI